MAKTLTTIGGLEITNFKILRKPISTHPLFPPMLFSGKIQDTHPLHKKPYTIQWDAQGKCKNHTVRPDACIDVNKCLHAIAIKE